jgi:hypothetical protein
MKKAAKAAFLSAIMGAGAGHLFLKRYRRGAFLIMCALCCLVVIATQAIKQAQVIFGQIPTDSDLLSFDEVSALLNKNFSSEDFMLTNLVSMLIMLIWTFAIFDAYKIGKDLDHLESADDRDIPQD